MGGSGGGEAFEDDDDDDDDDGVAVEEVCDEVWAEADVDAVEDDEAIAEVDAAGAELDCAAVRDCTCLGCRRDADCLDVALCWDVDAVGGGASSPDDEDDECSVCGERAAEYRLAIDGAPAAVYAGHRETCTAVRLADEDAVLIIASGGRDAEESRR